MSIKAGRAHGRAPGARRDASLRGAPRGPRASWGRGGALTADHAPAQLPDALLTGLFALKFTPEPVSRQGACWQPEEAPQLSHPERKETYRDSGSSGDAGHPWDALEAHRPRRARDALDAARAVGTLDAFRAQLPATAGLGETQEVGRGARRPGAGAPSPFVLWQHSPLLWGLRGRWVPARERSGILVSHMLSPARQLSQPVTGG